MRIGSLDAHLTYCTNVHPGERLSDVRAHVEREVPAVRAALGHRGSFGVGLRVSARAAAELGERERESLRESLSQRDLYVFTLNGFPYGAFHGERVKEQVFRPDWRHEARLEYTDRLAHVLAALLPDGVEGSISTLPCGARSVRAKRGAIALITERLLRHAALLVDLRERTGKTICLALEPEPFAHLETTDEAVSFLEEHVLARPSVRRFERLTGLATSQAEQALRRHVGLCLDACHMAVAWEDPRTSVRRALEAGVRIAKVQVSAALELDLAEHGPRGLRELARFADGVYLHQVFEREGDATRRWRDLDEALAEHEASGGASGGLWRVHFHVPVFRDVIEPFRSTQGYLRQLLGVCLDERACTHFEIETYTWAVIPHAHREEGLPRSVARELSWTERCLAR